MEKDGRKKRTFSGERERGRGGELFILRSGAKTYDIVPDKVAGFYFRPPLLSLPPPHIFTSGSLSLSSLFLSSFFFFARTPFSLCVFHEQHKFPPKKSTVRWHASTGSLIFLYPHLLSPSRARKSYYGDNSIIVSYLSKNSDTDLIIVIQK